MSVHCVVENVNSEYESESDCEYDNFVHSLECVKSSKSSGAPPWRTIASK